MKRFIIFFYNLNFKKVLVFSFLLSLLLSVPLIYLQLQRESRIFTEAGDGTKTNETIVDESKIPYPSNPPKIVNVAKFYGKPGDSVLIYGSNFGEAKKESKVLLNSVAIDDSLVQYWSNNEIEFSLPSDAGLYNVSVSVNGKTSSWFGKVNIYNDLIVDEITINDKTNFIKVTNNNNKLIIYSMTEGVKVFGTQEYEIIKKELPLDVLDSKIIYVELVKNGESVPFKVINP